MHTETQQAGNWWARRRNDTAVEWIANYRNSLQARHRTAIVEIVRDLKVETLLEVGAHCGPNLMRLTAEFPDLHTLGVDISQEAVAAGNAWAVERGVTKRVRLSSGRIPQALEAVPSRSVDVVLSCYSLAYIAPSDLDAVLFEMGRIAERAVIFAEPMDQSTAPSPSGYREWAHDYVKASGWIGSLRGATIRKQALTPPVDRLNAIVVAVR